MNCVHGSTNNSLCMNIHSTVEPSIPDTLGPVQWNPLFRTPWDQYSGTLYSGHLGTSTVGPSIPDTLGPVQWSPSILDTLGPVQWTPLFRTPWDQYSGTLYSGHLGTSTVEPLYSGHLGTSTVEPSFPDTLGLVQWNPSIPDTLGPVQWNLLFRTPWDQYSGTLYSGHLGTSTVEPSIPDTLGPERICPDCHEVSPRG